MPRAPSAFQQLSPWWRLPWPPEAIAAGVQGLTVAASVFAPALGVPDVLEDLVRRGPASYAALAVAGVAAALVWWRAWPGVLLAAIAPVVAAAVGSYPIYEWTMAAFAAGVATLHGRAPAPVAAVAGLGGYAGVAVYLAGGWLTPEALVAAAGTWTMAATGAVLRAYRQHDIDVAGRTEALRAAREAEVTRRVAVAKVDIARDLHDLIGHQLAVLNLHLGAVEIGVDQSARQTIEHVEAARQCVGAVLTGTRRTLAVLREPGAGTEGMIGYDRLPALVGAYRDAGLAIVADIAGAPASLSAEVGLATYRIVEEALTNAHRHGRGQVRITVGTTGGALVVSAENRCAIVDTPVDTLPQPDPITIRERAMSVGGQTVCGRRAGVFRLRVVLPLEAREPT